MIDDIHKRLFDYFRNEAEKVMFTISMDSDPGVLATETIISACRFMAHGLSVGAMLIDGYTKRLPELRDGCLWLADDIKDAEIIAILRTMASICDEAMKALNHATKAEP